VKPRIFISHSAKDDKKIQAVLDMLWAALCAADGYEVLLDVRTLRPGEGWRSRIDLWLDACDAAVVLLSESALTSPYVTYEMSVLAHRSARFNPSLLIIPVVFGEVTPAALQKSYLYPAQLDERQFVRGTPDEIVAKVFTRLGEVSFCKQTLAEKRAKRLSDRLRGIPEDVLREAADEVQLHLPLAADDIRLHLALQMLGFGMSKEVREALKTLRPHIPEETRATNVAEIIDLIAATWVDLRCSGRIPPIAKGEEEPLRAFGINARDQRVVNMYVLSASQEDKEGTWYLISCGGDLGEDLVGDLIRRVRSALRFRLNVVSDEDLNRELEVLDKDGQPVIVGLERPGITEAVLGRLRSELPHVTFFLYRGETNREGEPLSPSMFEPLVPELLEIDEATFLQQYQEFNIICKDRSLGGERFPHGLPTPF